MIEIIEKSQKTCNIVLFVAQKILEIRMIHNVLIMTTTKLYSEGNEIICYLYFSLCHVKSQ